MFHNFWVQHTDVYIQGEKSVEWTGLDGGSNVNSFCGKNVTLQENDVITGLSLY